MFTKVRTLLLATTALSFLAVSPVLAADAKTNEAIESLKKQVEMLQKQLETLQTQQQQQAAEVKETQQVAQAAEASAKKVEGLSEAKEVLPGVKLKVGGFVGVDGIWRDKNQTSDTTSSYSAIPYNNSVNAHQHEFRGSARSSRLSLLAEGKPDKEMTLNAYFETDFLQSGTSSNSVQTNSYVPRIRQGYASFDQSDWGFHVLGGQAWSMLTLSQVGITERKEALPNVIDSAYVPGVLYDRNAQIRFVKSFDDKKVNVGLSLESPQTNLSGVTVPTTILTATSTGGGSLNSTGQYSTDVAPDIIAKVAVDPGYGHYEVFGMTRFFHDNLNAHYDNNVATGYGVGVGAFLPVIDKKLEVLGTFMAGKGIGRYSAGQLPDIAFKPNGDIIPLTQMSAFIGLVGHPTKSLDLYLYAGAEKVMRENWNSNSYGYGSLTRNTAGCYTQGSTTCEAQTKMLMGISPGFWAKVYDGNYGNLKVGAQYELYRKDAFSGANDYTPHAFENVVMTTFRYSPF